MSRMARGIARRGLAVGLATAGLALGLGGLAVPAQAGAPADVVGLKTVAGQFVEGGTVTYTIILTNTGAIAAPDNAGNELTDVLPGTLDLVSASASTGTAVADTGTNTVTWNGAVPAQINSVPGTVTITITATVDGGTAGTTISNQAAIAFDPTADGTNDTTRQTHATAQGPEAPTAFLVASRPTVTVEQSASQADPAAGEPVLFTVTFIEPVTGFEAGDVTLGGTAGATTPVVSGSGTTYTLTVSGSAGDGTVIATVGAGVATSVAGLTNLASTSVDNTVTLIAPTGGSSTTSSTTGGSTTSSTTATSLVIGATTSTTTAAVGAGGLARTGSDDGPAISFLGFWLVLGGVGAVAYAANRKLRSARS